MMLLAAATLWLFRFVTEAGVPYLCAVSGFFMGGPAALLSSAVAADLGTHESLAGNSQALATVTGTIDRTASEL